MKGTKRKRSTDDEAEVPQRKCIKPNALDILLLLYMGYANTNVVIGSDFPVDPEGVRVGAAPAGYDSFIKLNEEEPLYLPLSPVLKTAQVGSQSVTTSLPVTDSPSSSKEHSRLKTRWGLPLTLNAPHGHATVMACPDTGSEENIISLSTAKALGLEMTTTSDDKREFELANGKVVEAIGRITTSCSFRTENSEMPVSVSCVFHVFLRLASPIIVGMVFLERTETLTKHRNRLVRIPRPSFQALQVYSVGRSRNELLCSVNEHLVLAIPDSGSDVDLMSSRFALERGFQILSGEDQIEFADGSVAITSGLVQAELALSGVDLISPTLPTTTTKNPTVDFFVLDGLISDVLVGEDSLEELKIFTENQCFLISTGGATGPAGLHRIRHLGPVGRLLSWIKERIASTRRRQGQPGGSYPLFLCQLQNERLTYYPRDFHQ